MTDFLLSLWALVPPAVQLGLVAVLLVVLVAWWEGSVNAETRAHRQRGIEVPLDLAVRAERLNWIAINLDKVRELQAWRAAGGVPSAPEAQLAALRDEVARLRAREVGGAP